MSLPAFLSCWQVYLIGMSALSANAVLVRVSVGAAAALATVVGAAPSPMTAAVATTPITLRGVNARQPPESVSKSVDDSDPDRIASGSANRPKVTFRPGRPGRAGLGGPAGRRGAMLCQPSTQPQPRDPAVVVADEVRPDRHRLPGGVVDQYVVGLVEGELLGDLATEGQVEAALGGDQLGRTLQQDAVRP